MQRDGLDPRFRELSADILASVSADEIAPAVVQHVQHRLAAGADEARVIEDLSIGARAIYSTWRVDVAVLDGGFTRFFADGGERLAGYALAAYELMGAEDYAAVMRAAIATFETERNRLIALPEAGTMEASRTAPWAAELTAVDQRYYALGDGIYSVWAASVRDRPQLFAPKLP